MPKSFRLLSILLVLCLPHVALALDATAAVKVAPLLKTTTTWNGAPIVYPQGQAEVTALVIEIAAGKETGWHEHPVPSLAYILEGNLDVTLATGEVKHLGPGDALAEVANTLHQGRALGDKPVKLVVFYVGAKNTALTVAHPEFQPAQKTAQ
ncbi:MAG TPA: cupin domain-containing protein [Rhodocyclaceae bacterium]|nr:cupin domain-containing protein [Rhodocyclaceae bacterium]